MSLEIARSELLIRIAAENEREVHPGGREVKAGIRDARGAPIEGSPLIRGLGPAPSDHSVLPNQ
jgi:hypothetical protein